MPLKPKHQRTVGRQPPTPARHTKAPRSPAGLPLPHERDESTDPAAVPTDKDTDTDNTPASTGDDASMAQAKRDIDAGMVDTDMRATSGLTAERRARLVPGPGGKPPATDD